MMRPFLCASVLTAILVSGISAQDKAPAPDYVTRAEAPKPGMAPGLKVTRFSSNAHTYELVFAKGDEVAAGLAEFAEKNHIKAAHFTAVGAFDSAVLGWYDPAKRAYKAFRLNEEMEIASFSGNIVTDRNGKPNVHAHCVVAIGDGSVHAGHFVEGHISLTMQLFLEDDGEPIPVASGESR